MDYLHHKFSIEFRSGMLVGHVIDFMCLSWTKALFSFSLFELYFAKFECSAIKENPGVLSVISYLLLNKKNKLCEHPQN